MLTWFERKQKLLEQNQFLCTVFILNFKLDFSFHLFFPCYLIVKIEYIYPKSYKAFDTKVAQLQEKSVHFLKVSMHYQENKQTPLNC